MIYLDTGCLLKLYYPEPESEAVTVLVLGRVIVLAAVHELELSNALELKLFRREANAGQVRATRENVEQDLRDGVLHRVAIAWDDVWREAASIARAHSRTLGCRSLDVLHCATALHVGAGDFVTTDLRQQRLATRLGLRCPRV